MSTGYNAVRDVTRRGHHLRGVVLRGRTAFNTGLPLWRVTCVSCDGMLVHPGTTSADVDHWMRNHLNDAGEPEPFPSDRCGTTGVDADGHCKRCGLIPGDDEDRNDCPPGFLRATPIAIDTAAPLDSIVVVGNEFTRRGDY